MFSRIKKTIVGYRELRYLAYHDTLTGLYNRNWLAKNIDNISKRYACFIDINDLREVNMNGHTEGDEHIKKCVAAIPLKDGDILIRYAGDEFLLFTDDSKIETNELFSVGVCKIDGRVNNAIRKSDKLMLESKLSWKTKTIIGFAIITIIDFFW